MYVRLTAEHRLVGLAGDHPPAVLVLVAVLVDADHVQYDHVVALRVQTAQSQLQRRKHPPDINRPTDSRHADDARHAVSATLTART